MFSTKYLKEKISLCHLILANKQISETSFKRRIYRSGEQFKVKRFQVNFPSLFFKTPEF